MKTPRDLSSRDPHLSPVVKQSPREPEENVRRTLQLSLSLERPEVTQLTHVLESGSPEEKRDALKALQHFATWSRDDGQALALRSSCPALLRLLHEGTGETTTVEACSALSALAAVGTNADIIRESGGLEALANVFRSYARHGNEKLACAAMRTLASLLLFSEHNRQAAMAEGLVKDLLQIIGNEDGSMSQELRYHSAAALHCLSFEEGAPDEIVKLQGLPRVVAAVKSGLSDCARPLATGRPGTPARQLSVYALGILGNVTAAGGMHEEAVAAGAAEAAAEAVALAASHSAEIASAGLSVLCDLAAGGARGALLESRTCAAALLMQLKATAAWNRKEATASLALRAGQAAFSLARSGAAEARKLAALGFLEPLSLTVNIRPPQNVPFGSEKLYASAETVWGCVEKALNTLAAMCVVQDSAEKLLELLSTSSLRELLQCSDRYVRVAALRLARALTDSSDKGSKLLRAGVVPLAVEEVTRFNSEHASPNDSCVIEAVKLLRNLAYFEGGVQYVVKACGAEPLVELLITDSTFALKAEVCQALKNMAADPNAIDYLSHSGVISAAVGVVREASLARTTSTPNRRDCSDDAGTSIVFATGLLRNMVADPDQSELATLAVQSGALPVVVSLLEQTPRSEVDVETFVQAAAALNNITIHDPCCEALVEDCPNCLSIFSRHLLSSQSPPGNQGDWDEAMLQIASVIYNATQSHRTRGRVARSCSLQAVVALLGRRQGLVQTLSQSCLSIANIATEPRLKQLPVDQGAIPLLVDILRDSRLDSVAPEACTALHNLAANSPENKGAVVAAGAIPELIRVCRASRPSADAHRRAASLLNLLANRNREVRDAIVRAGGLDFLKFH